MGRAGRRRGIGSPARARWIARPLLAALLALAAAAPGRGNVAFEQVTLATTQGGEFTSVAIGPDRKLYATAVDGEIRRWPLGADGVTGAAEVLNALRSAEGGDRLLIGFAFDPAARPDDLVAWVSHATFGFSGMPDWGGKITRLRGADLEQVQDYVVGLPRSVRDHVTNGIDFGPDGALYFLQGSNSAMGAPDADWSFRSERVLTAAVLRLDPGMVAAPPVDVQTEEGGSYDPYAAGAPLVLYATGARNAYDLRWHRNGELYVPTNGSAAGGNTPQGSPGAPCADGGSYAGPAVPGLTNVGTQRDYLFRVEPGGYYGHPNPTRCEFAMNGANPTGGADPAEVAEYPVGTAPDASYRGFAFDFDEHQSPNGVVEYTSDHFGGALEGWLLVARYSAGNDIIALQPGPPDGDVVSSTTGIPGFTGFDDPLDLVEDPCNGFLYVSDFGTREIVLLRPTGAAQPPHCATGAAVPALPGAAPLAAVLGLLAVAYRVLRGRPARRRRSARASVRMIAGEGSAMDASARPVHELGGIVPILPTPLTGEGQLDEAGLRRLVDYCAEQQFDAAVVLGSNGEFPYFGFDEKRRVMEVAARAADGRIPVIGSASAFGTDEAAALARAARAAGCSAVMAALPLYFQVGIDAAVRHFAALAAEGGLPVFYYHFPGVTGLDLSPEQIARIAAVDGVVGAKITRVSRPFLEEVIAATRPHGWRTFTGTTFLWQACVEAGGAGIFCPIPLLGPQDARALRAALREGDRARASEIQARLRLAIPLLSGVDAPAEALAKGFLALSDAPGSPSEARPAATQGLLKEALRLKGLLDGAAVRRPCEPPSEVQCKVVRRTLEHLGWL